MKGILAFLLVLIIYILYLYLNSLGAIEDPMRLREIEAALVRDKCNKPELIDRHLLQQSWFYDNEYSELAGAFGQWGFSLYEQAGETLDYIQGTYCIEGKKLYVKYYKLKFVPIRIKFKEAKIEYGAKLKILGEDIFITEELNNKKMVLTFLSDKNTRTFYRKN